MGVGIRGTLKSKIWGLEKFLLFNPQTCAFNLTIVKENIMSVQAQTVRIRFAKVGYRARYGENLQNINYEMFPAKFSGEITVPGNSGRLEKVYEDLERVVDWALNLVEGVIVEYGDKVHFAIEIWDYEMSAIVQQKFAEIHSAGYCEFFMEFDINADEYSSKILSALA